MGVAKAINNHRYFIPELIFSISGDVENYNSRLLNFRTFSFLNRVKDLNHEGVYFFSPGTETCLVLYNEQVYTMANGVVQLLT